MTKRPLIVVLCVSALCLALLLSLFAVSRAGEPYQTVQTYAMGTACAFTVKTPARGEDGDGVPDLVAVLKDAEALLSHRTENSLPARLLADGYVETRDERLLEVFTIAEELRARTGGLFSLQILPLTTLWDFNAESPTPPSEAELEAALAEMAGSSLTVGQSYVLLTGAGLDLGALGKGYATDLLAEVLREKGESGLLAVGGSIAAVGMKEDTPWKVGVRDPFSGAGSKTLGTLVLTDAFVSTSGSYEKAFSYNGRTYHHILNPVTGMPAESDLVSVTVVAKSGVLSDLLSTACFLVGSERAFSLASLYGATVVAVTKEGELLVDEELKDVFVPGFGWEVTYR